MSEYPYVVFTEDNEYVDSAANVDTLESVLYGDLSYHPGIARIVQVPMGDEHDETIERLEYLARINADCFGIPLDYIERVIC